MRGKKAGQAGGPRPLPRFGLRSLLTALAFGSLVLPLVIGYITVSLVRSGVDERSSRRFAAVRRELGSAVEPDGRGGLRARKGYEPPQWLLLVVADRAERIVFTNMEGLRAGDSTDRIGPLVSARGYGPPSSLPADKRQPTCMYLETVEVGGAVLGTYYALVWPIDPSRLMNWRDPLRVAFMLLMFSLFAALGAAAISALLVRDVMKLEAAAFRIASGDLETEVSAGFTREIARLSASMESMRRSLLEDRDRRARFLATISHDLRTPLTSIGGYLEAVEDGLAEDPAVLAHYVGIMEEKTKLLEERIQGLLDFARMDTDEWAVRFTSLDLAAFLGGLAASLGEEARLRGLGLELDLSALRGVKVQADPVLLSRVFENLFSNALRYSPDGGILRLAARPSLAELFIDIEDSGPGVSPADRGLVFEPFYRGAGRAEGHGLGLYIVKSVLRGHGWGIEVDDSPLGGARFRISIPLE